MDARIAAEVIAGTAPHRGSKGNLAGIIDSQADVGGWPALASAPAPADTDRDGMPDAWELARGLDPAAPADRNLVPYPEDGYTWLAICLDELAAPAFPIPVISSSPVSRTAAPRRRSENVPPRAMSRRVGWRASFPVNACCFRSRAGDPRPAGCAAGWRRRRRR